MNTAPSANNCTAEFLAHAAEAIVLAARAAADERQDYARHLVAMALWTAFASQVRQVAQRAMQANPPGDPADGPESQAAFQQLISRLDQQLQALWDEPPAAPPSTR